MKVKFNEIGRSMLEMLGVLAVTGVLSVGGIMGYRFAMDKYRANETLNELQIRVADLSRQMLNGIIELSVDEMGDHTRMGYPIRARISPQYADYFEVFLDEVPSGVCRQLLKSQWTIPYSIFVGTTEYEIDPSICNEAETVTLAYEFKDDLTEKKFIEEEERHETWRCYRDNDCKCATCEQGLCKTMCPENSGCAKSYDNPNSWMCCLKDSIVSGLCCTHVGENGECCDSNNKCCPKDKPLRDKDGNCYSCDEEAQINVEGTVENCAVCSNRLVSGSKKYCVLKCGLKGTSNENKPLMDTDGKCHTCDEEAGVNVKGVEENCNACSSYGRYVSNAAGNGNYCVLCGVKGSSVENKPLIYWATMGDNGTHCTTCTDNGRLRVINAETCIKTCPNRIASNSLHCGLNPCSGDTPLHYEGKCYPCDYGYAIPLMYLPEGKCKELCKNRKAENGQCVLESCPENKPLMDVNGGCHACDEEAGVNVKGVEENCNVCSSYGRYVSNAAGNGNYCVLCGVKGSSVENKPLVYWATMSDRTLCASCNDESRLRVIKAETCIKTCPNRIASNSLHCGLNPCSGDTPLHYEGKCYPCDYGEAIPLMYLPEGKCKELCKNRKAENGQCVLDGCPENKPLMDIKGGCHACDEEAGINVKGIEENCSVCSSYGRYISNAGGNGNYCVLCGAKGSSVENKPLVYWATMTDRSLCASCNDKNGLRVINAETCIKTCPNRYAVNSLHCGLDYCTDDVPLMDVDKNCHPCNEPLPIDVNGDETKCGACLNRTLEGRYCILNSTTN